MNILVACEYSGVVRDAFIKLGHKAVSCDFLPSDSPGPHLQRDVRGVLSKGWDMLIAFPDCTYLCSSGLHWNKRIEGREKKTRDALDFVRLLLDAPIDKIALENPVGCIGTRIRPASQYIQPYEFGEDASKKTGLWLKNLPVLLSNSFVSPRLVCCGSTIPEGAGKYGCPNCNGDEYRKVRPRWSNQTPGGHNRLGPSEDRWKLRARTYPGIADAMATQWAGPIK